MTDYRTMFDREFLYHFDLPRGRDVVVTIDRVTPGKVIGDKGRKSSKPLCYFVGKQRPLALNKTNGKTIAALYGTDCEKWRGKRIAMYVTTTEFGDKGTVECIRIRPAAPKGKDEPHDAPPAAPDQSASAGDEPPPDVALPTIADQMVDAARRGGER